MIYILDLIIFVGNVVEWLTHRGCDQHGLDSKLTRAILLNFKWTAISLHFRKQVRVIATPVCILGPPSLSCESGG